MKKTNLFYHQTNIFVCCLFACFSFLLFAACSDDDKQGGGDEAAVWDSPQRGSIATDETVDQPAAILGTIPSNLNEALSKRFTNLNDVVDANTTVLIVQGSALSTFAEEISTVYDNNGIVVITNPDATTVNDWFKQIGWPIMLADDGVEKELYAFSQYHQYILDAAYEGITTNEHLNQFIRWINETMNISVSTTPGNAETNIEKLINAQTITHTYSYDLKINEAHVIFSNPDDISGKGTFTAKYSIYPLYAFQGQQNSGDYYLVNAEYTAHNKDMCPVENINHMWSVKHGGVKTQLCGFYLTRYGVETILCSDINTHAPIGEFPPTCSPVPQTTHSSTSYTSGLSWGIGGELGIGYGAKGLNGSVTIKGEVTISNSQTRTLSDVDIMNQSTKNTAKYEYVVNNLPGPEAGHITTPPLVSTGNATLFGSWIWRVPTTTDWSTEGFWLATKVNMTYGSCHLYTSKADFDSHTASPKTDGTLHSFITPPNRVPTGLLKINNTNDNEYISDVEIINEQGKVEYSSTGKGSIAPDNTFLRYVPTGKYTVRFKMGPNAQSTKTYTLCDGTITIERGEEYELNSSFDFEEQ